MLACKHLQISKVFTCAVFCISRVFMPMAQRSLNLLPKETKSPQRKQVQKTGKRGQRKVTVPQVRPSSAITATYCPPTPPVKLTSLSSVWLNDQAAALEQLQLMTFLLWWILKYTSACKCCSTFSVGVCGVSKGYTERCFIRNKHPFRLHVGVTKAKVNTARTGLFGHLHISSCSLSGPASVYKTVSQMISFNWLSRFQRETPFNHLRLWSVHVHGH